MIHFSCDRCKQTIDPAEQLRYVVRLEIRVALDFEDVESEPHRDHLREIEEILDAADDASSGFVSDDVYQQKRFDLCPDCYRKFNRNPVGRDSVEFDFSKN